MEACFDGKLRRSSMLAHKLDGFCKQILVMIGGHTCLVKKC